MNDEIIKTEKKTLVSVIIPTFNRKETIKRAIESVLKQTYDNIECIIIDDGSEDGTENIIAGITSDKIRYIRLDTNHGASYARNIGIEVSKGDYIAFQDSDDFWLSTKIEIQLRYMIQKGLDVSFCRIKRITPDGKIVLFPKGNFKDSNLTQERILSKSYASTQTLMCKRKCFDVCKFDERLPRLQDFDLIIQLSNLYSLGYINEVLVEQYIDESSISSDSKKGIEAIELLFDKYKDEYELFPKAKSHVLTILATFKYQMGNSDEAILLLRQAIGLKWWNAIAWSKLLLVKADLLKYRYR